MSTLNQKFIEGTSVKKATTSGLHLTSYSQLFQNQRLSFWRQHSKSLSFQPSNMPHEVRFTAVSGFACACCIAWDMGEKSRRVFNLRFCPYLLTRTTDFCFERKEMISVTTSRPHHTLFYRSAKKLQTNCKFANWTLRTGGIFASFIIFAKKIEERTKSYKTRQKSLHSVHVCPSYGRIGNITSSEHKFWVCSSRLPALTTWASIPLHSL